MNTSTITFNEEVCTLSSKRISESYKSKQKHTIVYVSNPFCPEDLNWNGITAQPEHSVKGDDAENDKLWRKYNKAEIDLQKIVLDRAVNEGLLDGELVKELKWSRKAGCQCGCSSGWISRDYRRQSIWLTVTSPSKEEEKKARQREYLSKKEAETLASVII